MVGNMIVNGNMTRLNFEKPFWHSFLVSLSAVPVPEISKQISKLSFNG